MSGGAILAGVTAGSSGFGNLNEVAGAANKFFILTQPSSSATAGVVFAQQPVLQILDQFGNLRSAANGSADNSTLVSAARAAGSGILQGTTTVTASNGVVTFVNLSHNTATNITIGFTSPSVAAGTNLERDRGQSAAATRLAFTAQPANGTVGAALATQPAIATQDQFWECIHRGFVRQQNRDGIAHHRRRAASGNDLEGYRNERRQRDHQLYELAGGLSRDERSVDRRREWFEQRSKQCIHGHQGKPDHHFGALPGRSYGDAPFGVSATASSGLAVSFSIVSGPASISGGTLTITGAGKRDGSRFTSGRHELEFSHARGPIFHRRQGQPKHHLRLAFKQDLRRCAVRCERDSFLRVDGQLQQRLRSGQCLSNQ